MEDNNILPKGYILKEYKIELVLGQGGFGVTYLAYDINLNKKVVIKEFLPKEFCAREQGSTIVPYTKASKDGTYSYLLKKFLNEAKILASIEHPNIVHVFSFFKANNTAYFVMDYIEGESLKRYIERNKTLSEEKIQAIIMPVLEGLKKVHEKNYLHRDIATDNIYLRKNGMPMLIDFGAAKNAGRDESTSLAAIVKAGYSAPEQYVSTSIHSPATDIYAIGSVIYSMLSGKTAPESVRRQMALYNDLDDPLENVLKNYRDSYSEALLQSVEKAMQIKESERFQNVLVMQENILPHEKIKKDDVVEDKTPETPKKCLTWFFSVPLILALLALGYLWQKYELISQKYSLLKTEEKQRMILEQIELRKKEALEKEKLAIIKAKAKKELGESIDKGRYIKPALVSIPKGSYMMGSNNGSDDEKPVHKITIDYAFEMGKYEVTNEEFVKFLNDVGTVKENWFAYKAQDDDSHIVKKANTYSVENGYEKYPMIEVSWFGAKAYAEWLSKKTDRNYRLPTEAEWEYVARAGTSTEWSFGDNENELEKYAWYTANSSNAHKVGSKKANPWGVHDMHGNVWEWCEDLYINSYESTPRDGSQNTEGKEAYRVLRGGSWSSSAFNSRSAYRGFGNPAGRYNFRGFRILRTLP